ncbi:hypothetical protein OH77DRAFT_1419726 [Trametes cingulata]|nr:hypothetical protein OH77DRAFT_1419726 [Trametes cingulata]
MEQLTQVVQSIKSCVDDLKARVIPEFEELLAVQRAHSQVCEDSLRKAIADLLKQLDDSDATVKRYKKERDQARRKSGSSGAERDDLLDAMDRYNPEVTHRQEELHAVRDMAKIHHHPLEKVTAKSPKEIREKLRHELSYLIPLEPLRRSDGFMQLIEFRNWLRQRVPLAAVAEAPTRAVVSAVTARGLNFTREEARLCQNPILYLNDNVSWCTPPEHHGLIICPEYQYGPTQMYSEDCWTKSSSWRACAEQKREIFYTCDGYVHYGGTYICHSGPSSLQLGELGDMRTEILTRALAQDSCAVKRGKKRNVDRELVTIEQLYRENVLTVHIIGLERIGFNNALYESLAKRYKGNLLRAFNAAPAVPRPLAVPVAPLPVAGSSRLAAVPWPAPVHHPVPAPLPVTYATRAPAPAPYAVPPPARVHVAAPPPPSHIANAAWIRPNMKREREDDDLFVRAFKSARVLDPYVSEEDHDDEGYLFYCGTDYYRNQVDDDPSMYEDLDIPDILGEFERSGSGEHWEDDCESCREYDEESIYDDEEEDEYGEPALFGQ